MLPSSTGGNSFVFDGYTPSQVQIAFHSKDNVFTYTVYGDIYSEGTAHGSTMLSIGIIGDSYSLGVVTKGNGRVM